MQHRVRAPTSESRFTVLDWTSCLMTDIVARAAGTVFDAPLPGTQRGYGQTLE